MQLRVFLTLLAITATTSLAHSKDLSSRLGIGYSDQFSESVPSMVVRYYPNPKLGLSAALGVDTDEGNSKFGFMVKLYKVIFTEDNLNFYMGTGVGLISYETTTSGQTSSSSGFELAGFAGVEFFFTGLENLGFSFETGVGVTSRDSEVRFRTLGDHPVRAGMTFYF